MRTVWSLVGIAAVFFVLVIQTSYCVPFILIPGLGGKCDKYAQSLIQRLKSTSGSYGYCMDIEGSRLKTFFTPLQKQTDIVCEKVKTMIHLKDGYNIVGMSQGSMVARGVIEFCDGGPPVKNLISIGGPQAGIDTVPSGVTRSLLNLCKTSIYKTCTQKHLAPSGYLKIPTRMKKYFEGCKFLPKLNNEIPGQRNSTYKKRFSSLENLVLVMFEKESVIIPKESSWFGYYPDGASSPILPPKETKLYTEDWIGLRTLDEKGRVHFVKAPGDHLDVNMPLITKHIIPFLKNKK